MMDRNLIEFRVVVTLLMGVWAAVLTRPAIGQSGLGSYGSSYGSSGGVVVVQRSGSLTSAAPITTGTSQANSAAKTAEAEKPADKSPRLEELKKLVYTRRPSEILKVWSEPAAEEAASPPPPSLPVKSGEAPKVDLQALQAELKQLQRNVTLGRWKEVKEYFAGLPSEEANQGYAQMVKSLATPAPPEGVDRRMAQMQIPGVGKIAESNLFTLDDVLAVINACPQERTRETILSIIPILNAAMERGVMEDSLLERLHQQHDASGEEAILTKAECAWLLEFSGRIHDAEPFLPTYQEARKSNNAESLILLARCYLARYEKQKQPEILEKCWSFLQTACFMTEAEQKHRDDALTLVLSLVPRVREELGMAWLETTFAEDPEFGMKILASTGTSASTALQASPRNPATRLANLKVQKTVVESLLDKSPDRADAWNDKLRMLAGAWLREAEFSRQRDTSSSRGPSMRRDAYGNFYYMSSGVSFGSSMSAQPRGNQPAPISSGDILEVAPSEGWISRVEDVLRPKFLALLAQLYLKVSEEEKAFPYIERIAAPHPELAKDLVHEFIRVWTRNNDPNSSRSYTSSYMYFYGFERRASGIPLTRSKQQRNIKKLTEWVARVRKLELEDLDESLLAKAFTTCHSSAEVYRLEDIETVFGSVDGLQAETLAQFVQQMRTNLSGIWRMPANQEEAKTKRKQKDIQQEVLRGYAVAFDVVNDGLRRYPENWQLQLARACLRLDEATFHNEIAPSSEFSEKRLAALDDFRSAAQTYATAVPTLEEEKQAATVYEHWFYAGLGASDLNQVDHECVADPRQPALIREAIIALPGEAAESHMEKFANSLFTRMSSLSPAMKFQYLEAGFEIAGDNEHAHEAKQVYDYYNDLVTEIKLIARLDGPGVVGHLDPFGVFVEIHHTKEIERESGGFSKYLQNQQNARYAYNYGRPLTNYRDKFEEGVRAALEETFDVLSVTFADEKDVRSMATDHVGWRNTPYAYLLLQPHGPEIDKLPSLKIDLDFLDTSGYVVLPITSAPVPMDARPEATPPRPYEQVSLTQILDEREAASDKLKLEIKASGRGLIPRLEHLVDVRTSDFEMTDVEDQGVLVSRFDAEGDLAIVSERTWIVDYAGRTDLAALPTTFSFPDPKGDPAEISYMRYEDADLKTVESTVSLAQEYGEVRQVWPWALAIGSLLLAALGVGVYSVVNRRPIEVDSRWALPDSLTPFNVLALLRDIERNNGFDPQTRQDLATNIRSIEHYYFAGNGQGDGQQPDLRSVAETWSARAR